MQLHCRLVQRGAELGAKVFVSVHVAIPTARARNLALFDLRYAAVTAAVNHARQAARAQNLVEH